jgi:hypothetical protein
LFCSIRHPLIIAPIAAQRQALLTERLRNAFAHDAGSRIDHLLVSPSLSCRLAGANPAL